MIKKIFIIHINIPYKGFDRSVCLSFPSVEYFANANRRSKSKRNILYKNYYLKEYFLPCIKRNIYSKNADNG